MRNALMSDFYPGEQDSLLASRTLTLSPLLVVLHNKHRLAGRRSVNIKDLAHEPFIANTRPQSRSSVMPLLAYVILPGSARK
jgi:DNA-binding transcriptional LysR family regulator